MYIRLGFSVKNIIVELIGLFELMIVLRAFFSWFASPYSSVMRFLTRATEPVIRPVRNVVNRVIGTGMFDFSPVLAVMLLELLKRIILWL